MLFCPKTVRLVFRASVAAELDKMWSSRPTCASFVRLSAHRAPVEVRTESDELKPASWPRLDKAADCVPEVKKGCP